MTSKAHWQIAGVMWERLLLWIDQKTESRQTLGRCQLVAAERLLQRAEPGVVLALYLRSLWRVVTGLPIFLAPLPEVMQCLRRLVLRQIGMATK